MAMIAAVKRTASFEPLFSASIIVIIHPSSPQLFNFVLEAHNTQKMDSFVVNRALLNPKFEGYKLEAIPQEQAVSRYALSRKPTQATASGRLPLSFEEMRSRITHNHLAVDAESGQAAYVDQDYNVCLVGIPAAEDTPSFRILYEMATPMDTSGAVTVQREYPSSVFLSATAVAATDGNGFLYILPIREGTTSDAVGTFTLCTGGAVDAPFRIHYVHRLSPITTVLLLSSRFYPVYQRKPPPVSENNQNVQFDIWAVKIDLLSLRPGSETRQLEVLWHRRGQDVPIYATFVEEIRTYLIVSGSSYPDENATKTKPHELTPDEIAPIPRYGENLDSKPNTLTDTPPRPLPYSWTQTSDSVTVAFPLPDSTPKTKMKVIFTTQTLTLHIDALPLQCGGNPPVPIPHYSVKALWDSVNPSSCFWTWDREAEHAYGILTLHMEKRNEGTRWMQVFAASASSTAEDTENPEVPETVDPSELWHIRESLEKYTSALRTGEDASGLGLGRGVPNIMEGEMDEDADASVGRNVYATWIGEGGQTPEWTLRKPEGPNEKDWEEEPMTLLSTPLPGSSNISLVLKNDLDGPVFSFSLPSAHSTAQPSWKHTSTYSALAFVLASKQDTRFIYHLPGRGVLAFEGGSLRDRGANVYVYRPQQKAKDIWAKQSVLQVDDGSGGALLGVGCVKARGGKEGDVVLVCLTEGELVLIRGL
ncbi:unnamed protein product [Cyclocybe aegerita]|uniref:NudC domain-containing protein 1 n=1 Tax=Cyclocybe aegerita TaxID=1973307 RepID=A0A8S0W414_CYCAE|nr:unnamed protein product [Cyclocybe aegerita]